MKIFTAAQLRMLDAYTIEQQSITSLDLMERAAKAFTDALMARWGAETSVKIFAGPGNNGGDALAVARLLAGNKYSDIEVYLFNTSGKLSDDCNANFQRLRDVPEVKLTEITTQFVPPTIGSSDLIIDGLFGTGLSRPLNGGFASVVKYINASGATIVSIDIPSGLMCEDNTYNVMNHIVHAHYTFTFHSPKLAFLFSEHEKYCGTWTVLDIGIQEPADERTETPFILTEKADIKAMLRPRSRFSHKGTVGHALLIAGKRGMAGAAIMASRACMRSGAGKLTLHTPECNMPLVQVAVPEVVVQADRDADCFCRSVDTSAFDALAIGPGIGTASETAQAFIEQVRQAKCPTLIDADAINILGMHRGWITQMPKGCIFTPHKKELFGLISNTNNSYEELERTRELAQRQQVYIIVKGAFSAVCTPSGNVYFNTTGNAGMATAGSGDVLTGIILALLAQDYSPEQACRFGVFLHGLAGDMALENQSEESLIATDIIDNIGKAFKHLKS